MKKLKKSKLQKVLTVIGNAVLVLSILVGLMVVVSLLPFKNNYKIMAVMSGSMAPTISTGSIIVIKPATEYKLDDVVTFKSYNSQKKNDYTTHRVVGIDDITGREIFYTKGDANESRDSGSLTKDQIKGKVIFSVAFVGYIVGYAKTLPGLVIIIITATIIVYEELKKIRSEVGTIKESKKVKESKKKKSKEGKKGKAKK